MKAMADMTVAWVGRGRGRGQFMQVTADVTAAWGNSWEVCKSGGRQRELTHQ